MSILTKETFKQEISRKMIKMNPDEKEDYLNAFMEILIVEGENKLVCSDCGKTMNPRMHIYCRKCYL